MRLIVIPFASRTRKRLQRSKRQRGNQLFHKSERLIGYRVVSFAAR